MSALSSDDSVVLLVGASPTDKDALLLSAEFDLIDTSVRQGTFRDDITVRRSQNTLASELVPDLLRNAPSLVHFSGHGRASGELVFEDANGASAPLTPDLLAAVFSGFSDSVRCVVLNACWSDTQAGIIAAHVSAVAGMSTKVSDLGSLNFSSTFYLAISEGKSVSEAFSLAVLQLRVASPGDAEAPVLRIKPGAGEVVLAGPRRFATNVSSGTSTEAGSQARQDLVTDLFTVHYGPLVRIASTLLDDNPGAEEMVRAAFVDLLYSPVAPASGDEPSFLRTHVMNAAVSALNKRQLIEDEAGTSQAAKRARVLNALRALPSPQSEVLVLKHLAALDHEQIGEVLELDSAVVATSATNGLDALGALLDGLAA